jgi:hypothetical protein
LQEKTKMVTTTTGDPAIWVTFSADVSCIHFMENERLPDTTTGFLGLKTV